MTGDAGDTMRRGVRLLFVVNDAPFFVSHRMHIARAALRAGFDVHVAVPADGAAAVITTAGLTVHHIPLERAGVNPVREIRTVAALLRLYRSIRPDIVHHVTQKPVLYGTLAARLAGVPAIVNALAGLGYLFLAKGNAAKVRRRIIRWSYRILFRHPNLALIVQNRDDQALFTDSSIVPAERVLLIKGSGVDLQEFEVFPEPEGPPIVILAARMLRDKGVFEFVEAARISRAKGISARFVLAGDVDPNPSAISSTQLRAWTNEAVVEWWGYRSDMAAVLPQAAIVCLPSYREGLPKVILEAMACGRAVVATDVPGCREAVIHGETGLLVPARDPVALAAAITALLQDPARRHAFGRRGRERAGSEFSSGRVAAETLQLYSRLAR